MKRLKIKRINDKLEDIGIAELTKKLQTLEEGELCFTKQNSLLFIGQGIGQTAIPINAGSAQKATSADRSTSDAAGNNIQNTYATKTEVNAKQDKLSIQTAFTGKGTSKKVPKITTNALGQVTNVEEVDIDFPKVTLNGEQTNTPSFYAPTSRWLPNLGTQLVTNVGNKPSWTLVEDIQVGKAVQLADLSKIGSNNNPVYFNDGMPVACDPLYESILTCTFNDTIDEDNKFILIFSLIDSKNHIDLTKAEINNLLYKIKLCAGSYYQITGGYNNPILSVGPSNEPGLNIRVTYINFQNEVTTQDVLIGSKSENSALTWTYNNTRIR